MDQSLIKMAIEQEMKRAAKKYPFMPEDIIHSAAIVSEKSGELQKEVLQYTYENGSLSDVIKEAVQVAVTAIRFLMNIEDMKKKPSL